MDRPRSTVVITEFPGLVSNRGRFPQHPGDALVQTNLRSTRDGLLESRLGLKAVAWGSGSLGNSKDLISVYYYDASTPKIVAQEATTGRVWYGLTPS